MSSTAPVCFLCQEVFGLGQQAALESFGPSLAGALHGQLLHILLIACGSAPGVVAGVFRLGGDASQGDEHLALQPILRWPKHALAEGTMPRVLAIRQHADALDWPAEYQRDDGMAGFVVGSGGVISWFHVFDSIFADGKT